MLHHSLAIKRRELIRQRLKKEHTIAITGVFVILTALAVLGANIPGFYPWIDSANPVVQFLVLVVPMSLFAFWRLRKMLRL